MKGLNNSSTLSLFNFIIVLFVTVSCTGNDSGLAKTTKKKGETENKKSEPINDDEAPACYAQSDVDSPDTTSLRVILKKISDIKEVRDYSNQNPNQILYCVSETKADDVYQSNSYLVQVVLDTEDHYSTRFNFYVNKQTKEIKIVEVVSGLLMSVKDWRKAQ